MDQLAPAAESFPAEPVLQAIRAGQSAAVQLAPGQALSPADLAAALDISQVRFLVAGKPHDLVSFADQISAGAALDGKAGRDAAFRVLTTVDAKSKSIVLVITDANTLSSEATLQFLANAMSVQRRLCLVLVGQGALEGIVLSPLLAPVRKRFVLLAGTPALDAPGEAHPDGLAPIAVRTVEVTQTPPSSQRSARRSLPVLPVAAGAGALVLAGAVLLSWPKPAPPPAPASPRQAAALPAPKAASVIATLRPASAPATAAPAPIVLPSAAAAPAKIVPVLAMQPPKPAAVPVRQPDMVKLPAGAFRMGSTLDRSEAPVHLVSVGPFAIAPHAVTVQMWAACVQAGACKPAGQGAPDAPVTNVSWDDANAYAAWLTGASGVRYRLPTEAEWEYAARAGSAARYAWGDTMLAGRAACADCGAGHAAQPPAATAYPATAYPANAFGLTGMGGGVAEWVQDCWHKNYDGAPAAAARAWEAAGCAERVLRGGSWESKAADIRTASRDSYDASVRYPTHGFRLVRADAAVTAKPLPGKS